MGHGTETLSLFDPPIGKADAVRFNGSDYDPAHDRDRLAGQLHRVYEVMRDARWRTLHELQEAIERRFGVHDPHASCSAQLRHLRKSRFGGHTIEKRARGERSHGLYEYRLLVSSAGLALARR